MASIRIDVREVGVSALELLEQLDRAGIHVSVEQSEPVTGDALDFDLGEIHFLVIAIAGSMMATSVAQIVREFINRRRCQLYIGAEGMDYHGPTSELERVLATASNLRVVPQQRAPRVEGE